MQLLFVNGRLLRSAMLAGAWTSGYSTFAMIGRHPYGVVFLDLPPEHVDPNVHPTKSDVRLRYGSQVFDAVRRTIAATLTGHAKARALAQTQHRKRRVSFAPAESLRSSTWPRSSTARLQTPTSAKRALRVLAQLDRTFILATRR